MSLKLTTDRELDEFDEMRYLNCTESEHLTALFLREGSKYQSFFPFSYNDKTVGERFVGYAGALQNDDWSDASFDEAFPQDVDIYICANSMKSGHKRGIDNLINIQNLVIDIDSHDSALSMDDLNEHILKFEKKLLKKLIIKPNLINRTGRGLHLWFCIEPCHVALSKICLSVVDMLCSHIAEIMLELNELELSIDKASSLKLNGLFRLPYTYNTKAKRWSECRLIHQNYPNINKIRKKLLSKGYSSEYFIDYPKKSKAKKKSKAELANDYLLDRLFKKYRYASDISTNDYTPCLIHRKNFLEQVILSRGGQKGTRDLLMFALYATVIGLFEKDDAQAYCEEWNSRFAEPLKTSKLCEIFKDVDRKRYKFTVKKFLDLINATDEERALYHKLSVKETQKRERHEKKQERNRKVKELHEQGLSIVAISKEMKLSRPTIYKILASE